MMDIPTRLAGAKRSDGSFVFGTPVREPCRDTHYKHSYLPAMTRSCAAAGCRGWTASKEGWEEAAIAAGANGMSTFWDRHNDRWHAFVSFDMTKPTHDGTGATAQEARMAALLAAVLASGAEVPG